jgi:hypothetical protein
MSLDREIEDLLAVDPSPEFVAKVRQRVAAEPAPSSWWLSWRPATAAVGFAALAAAALLWPSAAPVAPRDDKTSAPATGRRSAPTSEAGKAPVASTLAAGTASVDTPSHRRASAAPNRPASSPVLIQRDEAKAMNLLLTRVRDGTLPDMTETLAGVDATGPEWIAIPPVAIEPIAMGEGE